MQTSRPTSASPPLLLPSPPSPRPPTRKYPQLHFRAAVKQYWSARAADDGASRSSTWLAGWRAYRSAVISPQPVLLRARSGELVCVAGRKVGSSSCAQLEQHTHSGTHPTGQGLQHRTRPTIVPRYAKWRCAEGCGAHAHAHARAHAHACRVRTSAAGTTAGKLATGGENGRDVVA